MVGMRGAALDRRPSGGQPDPQTGKSDVWLCIVSRSCRRPPGRSVDQYRAPPVGPPSALLPPIAPSRGTQALSIRTPQVRLPSGSCSSRAPLKPQPYRGWLALAIEICSNPRLTTGAPPGLSGKASVYWSSGLKLGSLHESQRCVRYLGRNTNPCRQRCPGDAERRVARRRRSVAVGLGAGGAVFETVLWLWIGVEEGL